MEVDEHSVLVLDIFFWIGKYDVTKLHHCSLRI